MLDVDLSRPARSQAERLALIRAVVDAPTHEPETDWIEWKTEIDLTTRAGALTAARSILGFGNRDPDFSATYASGCAYLIAGAVPGHLPGVPPHDLADVEQWLTPYVAAGEPQWSADYLDLDGKTVMLITVEAPQWGDPIFTLRKGGEKAMAGAIYVRSQGTTHPASPDEIRRLTTRASKIEPGLGVHVEAAQPIELVALGDTSGQERVFVMRETERLERYSLRPASPYALGVLKEMRSEEEYDEAVASYLSRAGERYRLLVQRQVVDLGVTSVALRICNRTDQNFPQTQVVIRLPRDIRAYFGVEDIDEQLDGIKPPDAWGEQAFIVAALRTPRITIPGLHDGRRIDHGAETVVTLPPIDVRPGTDHVLRPFDLVLAERYAGTTLPLPWRATSTGVTGESAGMLELAVASSPAVPVPALAELDDE